MGTFVKEDVLARLKTRGASSSSSSSVTSTTRSAVSSRIFWSLGLDEDLEVAEGEGGTVWVCVWGWSDVGGGGGLGTDDEDGGSVWACVWSKGGGDDEVGLVWVYVLGLGEGGGSGMV